MGSFLDAVQRAALADSVEHVRSSAVAFLGKHLNESPMIAETLSRVARNDAKPDVRRLAREVLDTPAGGR